MAFYQRVSTLFLPTGGAAAAVVASRCTASTTTTTTTQRKLHQVAAQRLNRVTNNRPSTGSSYYYQRRNFSAIPKEIEAATQSSSSTTKATATNSSTSSSKGFVEWYERHLNARPVLTKAITGSILWGFGDIVAQVVPGYFEEKDDNTADGNTTTTKKGYDLQRTARAVTFGFVLHAPLSHLHFNFLEWMTVKSGLRGLHIPVFKTIMEQFVYWSWFSNSLYHGAMGAMQGMNFQQMYDRVSDVLWDTQVAQWSFWIPIQLLNFQFVPVRHQLNVVLLTSVVWTALLSAWYPPEVEEEKKAGEGKIEEV